MSFEFAGLSYDEIVQRLMDTEFDDECYRQLVSSVHSPEEAKGYLKEYQGKKKKGEKDLLKKMAKECAERLPRYSGFDWTHVVFDTVIHMDLPDRWTKYIFSATSEEKDLYQLLYGFLKKKHGPQAVYRSYMFKGKAGRFADFTAARKKFLGAEVTSVSVMTKPVTLERQLEKAGELLAFSDQVYVATTPAVVFALSKKYETNPFSDAKVRERLQNSGVGLYIVDLTSNSVRLVVEARRNQVEKEARGKALEDLKKLAP
ncbi:MAG: hypothetical protein JRN39_07115 [Nitrososphaerota archaeon]|nr:hypothetical protein [Nitrososphaerota archaeon]MDG6940153.1 hypothetical protein [Nitrososphaerota archaeon]